MSQAAKASSTAPARNTAVPSGDASGTPAAAAGTKKRCYTPSSAPPSPSDAAVAANLRVWHQKSTLSLVYVRPITADPASWRCQGQTVLYVVQDHPAATSESNLALHLRGNCRVFDVQAETVTKSSQNKSNQESSVSLSPLSVSHLHADPLARVLIKPAQSYTEDDVMSTKRRYDADSQCSRGAVGMTTGLRVASVASNMGELRLSVSGSPLSNNDTDQPNKVTSNVLSKEEAFECWKKDLSQSLSEDGKVVERLKGQLYERSTARREARVDLVANRMAEASIPSMKEAGANTSSPTFARAIKLTIRYEIPLENPLSAHLGGIHFCIDRTPHVYTTAGVTGDHEGPRSWIPCLDSASRKHRASHELVIKVTAPMREGLSAVGCGEDFGASESLLHDLLLHEQAEGELGQSHVQMMKDCMQQAVDCTSDGSSAPHLIPPDQSVVTIDSILATSIWSANVWTPIPARSLGFAVGPFKVLHDPEYYKEVEEDEDNSNEKELEQRKGLDEAAGANGTGIRQAYFAPLVERKYIHAEASMTLLPNTDITLAPLRRNHMEQSKSFEQAVSVSTAGVPNRALSLMRDVLALPAYRTASYTQIWIPDAVHGGSTSGALHCCPDVLLNPFLGGAIMDSRLFPPIGRRLPYYRGGRVLQFLQARCSVRGWITAALPLGGDDDVGFGYIHTLIESFIMSVYERAHGAHGEGGARGSIFFTKRYALESGLNSRNLDFLPVPNIEEEELDMVVGGVVGAVPIEDRNNDQLWRSASNGSESHTSAMDEFSARQVLIKDIVDALERGTDKDRSVPLPSMGWLGSHLSSSFLSSNSTSSSSVGCGSLELVHPVGGLVYRTLKCALFRRCVEGRAGISNLIRVIRAAFIAAHLEDKGETELKLPEEKDKNLKESHDKPKLRPPFLVCVDELVKKGGLTHTLFIRALRIVAGPIREPHLRGMLVDVDREFRDARTHRQFVEPEGFPNSYVRGASELYLRVGVHVETGGTDGGAQAPSAVKGTQLHVIAEPVIPAGGIAYGGPVTLRVVENEGQLREFVRTLKSDGSRCEWGPVFLHAKPVTTQRQQTAASGAIEGGAEAPSGTATKGRAGASTPLNASPTKRLLGPASTDRVFTDALLHGGGYQAIELVRLTNRTPLLWVRVDPMGLYGGRISIFQPDACLAEQLFHDGDAGAQIEACRALAERPLRIQGSVKITTVYDVNVSELPVRVLGDCLRGAPALHSSLPHTPAVRVQAALAIAQWQNNKAPTSKDTLGADSWVGVNLLIQYFKERYFNNGIVVPVKFTRLVLKKNEAEERQSGHIAEGGSGKGTSGADDAYQYLDTVDDEEKPGAIDRAEELEAEEDEEYRVRAAVITAIASIRAKDGMTPAVVLSFLEAVLISGDTPMVGNLVSPDEEAILRKKRRQLQADESEEAVESDEDLNASDVGMLPNLPFTSSTLVANALLALCHVNVRPALIEDPATGKSVQSKANHPVLPLLEACRRWLEWELYRETIRSETEAENMTGIGGGCYTTVAACATTALYSLVILRQSTTDPLSPSGHDIDSSDKGAKRKADHEKMEDAAASQFYMDVFDKEPRRPDVTRAASAQAVACIGCAADRFEKEGSEPLGLLSALEFMLDRILETSTSPGLRQTLALLMLDSCTGKVCSMQRVAAIGGRGDLCTSAARFMMGPLGGSYGGDNGSALLMVVSEKTYPAANAVNDGARRGLRLLSRAGYPRDTTSDQIIVRVAKFATLLWRTINGEQAPSSATDGAEATPYPPQGFDGVCSYDGHLRCTLLSLWQWIWPKGCFAVLRVQAWRSLEGTQHYKDLGADEVMKVTDEEKEAATAEEASLADLNQIVLAELDRQEWRGEMVSKAYDYYKADKKGGSVGKDVVGADQAIGQPLPPIKRDNAFKQGGWIASAAQQRRAMTLDGGTAVTKIRLTVAKSSSNIGE